MSNKIVPLKTPLGRLPGGWKLAKLKDITVKIGSGATPRGGDKVYLTNRENFALIRSQNVFDRYFSDEGLAFISDEHAEQLKPVWLQPNDVLLNITGDGITFSRSCIIPEKVLPACVNQHVSIIRTNPDLCHPGYLLSYLTHPLIKKYIESFNSGGSRRAITKGHIESFIIPLPPLPEQRAIAHILSSLDDKIELNRQMNQTLEEIARALFKAWFIDFEPVRAKAADLPPTSADPITAALFPNRLVESELGLIPEGWRVCNVPDIIQVNPLRSPPKNKLIPYLEMKNLPTDSARPTEWEYREFGSGMKFMNGDVLLARITPCLENGKTAYIDFLDDDQVGWGSTEYIVLRSKTGLPTQYTYFLARSNEFRSFAIQNMTGTTGRQRVPVSCFDSYKMVVPPPEIAYKFGTFAGSVMEKMKSNDEQARTLIELRDSLLPKLISGQVRVGEAKEIVEAA